MSNSLPNSLPAALRARLALESADPAQAQRAALVLSELGFKVVQIGPRGVGFEGAAELFQKVFRSRLQTAGGGFTFASEPQLPSEFAGLRASVYFPTKPEFFQQKGKFV